MKIDMKFEVAIVPVSDVDRSKAFYTKLGFRVDDDIVNGDDFRVVQLTPPGSAASVSFPPCQRTAVPSLRHEKGIATNFRATTARTIPSAPNGGTTRGT